MCSIPSSLTVTSPDSPPTPSCACVPAADLSASVLVTKECWNKLFVPVDTSKVAHGDANLDIFDFLASCN